MLAPLTERHHPAQVLGQPANARPATPWRLTLLLSNLTLDGGAEVQAVQLALRLAQRDWDVEVVSMLPPKEADVVLAESGIRVLTLGLKGKIAAPSSVLQFADILRRRRPHIVHAHMSHAILLARTVRLIQPVPVLVGTLHGLKMYNVRGTGWRFREMLNRVTDGLSDATTVVCEAAARRYGGSGVVSRKKLHMIPNGVDTGLFRRDPEIRRRTRAALDLGDQFAWLQVGRFQPVKDHYTMLRAFARVAAEHPSPVLLLAGDGPLRPEMTDLAKALGIASRVRFLGTRTDIPALMNAADAVVLSSVFEAMPLVLLEAAATALPCVATDVGGNADIVLDGSTGFLTPCSDHSALAQAMSRLLALSPPARNAMGARAREHVTANYGFDRIVDRWESLYTELLQHRGVRP